MVSGYLLHDDCTIEFLIKNGIQQVQYETNVYCPDCQNEHCIIYDYVRPEGENGFIIYETLDGGQSIKLQNNRTGDIMFSLEEVVSKLQRQLASGIEVQYY